MYEINTNAAGASGSNYATTLTSPERQPEVLSEMDALGKQCEILNKQFDELEAKLMSVTRPRAETAHGDQKQPEPVRVPLAQAVHDRVKHLSQLSEQLQSLIGRIEV